VKPRHAIDATAASEGRGQRQHFRILGEADPYIGVPRSMEHSRISQLKSISIYCVLLAHPIYLLSTCTHFCNRSIHRFEKNYVQGLPRDFRQNNPKMNLNKKFRWSFSAISHQLSFDMAKKEKRKRKSPRVPNLANMGDEASVSFD
jgi:hypothetical protein